MLINATFDLQQMRYMSQGVVCAICLVKKGTKEMRDAFYALEGGSDAENRVLFEWSRPKLVC